MNKETQDPKVKFEIVIRKVVEEMVKSLDTKEIAESLSTIIGVTSSQHILEEIVKNLEPNLLKKLKDKKANLGNDHINIFEE